MVIRPGLANDDLREAVAAIERVHGDGELPAIPILLSREVATRDGRRVDGLFRARIEDDGTVTPISIHLRSDAPNRQYLVLHEIGHFLDANALPGTGFSSEAGRVLSDWRRTVLRSRAYQELEELVVSDNPEVSTRATEFLAYDELWARSYAQFIIHGGSESLFASLEALRRLEQDGVYFPCQWDDDDFVAIEAAIDGLFRRLGWIA